MAKYSRIIFVGRSGTCRAPMAVGIMKDCMINSEIEILARGLIVSFPEPMNQKAEAVLISNGINMAGFSSAPLTEDEITENTLVLVMERAQLEKVYQQFPNVLQKQVHVLTEYVGDELEIMNPYGGSLPSYGLCYEMLRKTIKKLIKKLNENN